MGDVPSRDKIVGMYVKAWLKPTVVSHGTELKTVSFPWRRKKLPVHDSKLK